MKYIYFTIGMFIVLIIGIVTFFWTPIMWVAIGALVVFLIVDDYDKIQQRKRNSSLE